MMKIEKLFENKKQKVLWLVFVVLIINKLFSLPTPTPEMCKNFYMFEFKQFDSTASCNYQLIPYWSSHVGGYLIYFIFMTAVFVIIASLLKNKEKNDKAN